MTARVRSLAELPRADILGTRVTASRFHEAVHALNGCIERREAAVFSAATVHSVMLGYRDLEYRAVVNASRYVMADGVPLVWAARRLGHAAERVHGDDLMLECARVHLGWRWFLLGGVSGQPEAVCDALHTRFPELVVVGTHPTPKRPLPEAENERVLEKIRESGADVVWVGMGTPAQDAWMAVNRERVDRPLVGVGSAFDLLSGRTRPTPEWMKRRGLQWVHRLVQEPRRLAGRYGVHNTLFLWHFGQQLASARHRRRRARE